MIAVRRGDPSPEAIELMLSLAGAWTAAEIAAECKESESAVVDILARFANACAACGCNVQPVEVLKLTGIAIRLRCVQCGRER